MIYVVERETERILNRCDGWEANGVDRMCKEAEAAGYTVLDQEITFMGDMVIWVRR